VSQKLHKILKRSWQMFKSTGFRACLPLFMNSRVATQQIRFKNSR
jgi:hypothetical protein